MTSRQIAIVYAVCIRAILSEYDAKESTRAILEIRGQIKKFMYKSLRSNTKQYLQATEISEKAWSDTIDEYKELNLKVEAVSLVVALWSAEADRLTKFANLSQKRIDHYALMNDGEHELEVEQNAYKVADSLIKNIRKYDDL